MTWLSGQCLLPSNDHTVLADHPDDRDRRELLLLASTEVGYLSVTCGNGNSSHELEPPAQLRPVETLGDSGDLAKILRLRVVAPADVERDRELFAAVAATRPDLIRTVSLLVAELADVDLPPELLRGLGGHMRRLGDTMTMRADRILIDT